MSSKNVLHADNQQASRIISDEYLTGFVDGEGCFYVGFSKRPDLRNTLYALRSKKIFKFFAR